MPGGLTLLASSDADIPTPPAGKVTIFFSTDLPGPAYKNDAGVVTPLGSTGATGATGPAGPMSIFLEDPLVGEDGFPGATGVSAVSGGGGDTYVVATVDESVSDDILQNDDVLFFSVDANSVYIFEGFLHWSTGGINTVDAKAAFTFPIAATLSISAFIQNVGNTSLTAGIPSVRFEVSSPTSNISTGVVVSSGNAIATPFWFSAILRTGANAGTLQLQWAQNTNTPGTPLVREKESWLKYRKVS